MYHILTSRKYSKLNDHIDINIPRIGLRIAGTRHLGTDGRFSELFSKIQLSLLLRDRTYYPQTSIEHEIVDFDSAVYYMKRQDIDNGDGIRIMRELSGSVVPDCHIVQEGIDPYLIDGYKFTIRVNVLLNANKEIFIPNDGEVKFCKTRYRSATDKSSNLTNTCKSEKNPISTNSYRIFDNYFEQIRSIILDSLNLILGVVKFNVKEYYHLLGFDFMIDRNGSLYILEINAHPGYSVRFDENSNCVAGDKIVALHDVVRYDEINQGKITHYKIK